MNLASFDIPAEELRKQLPDLSERTAAQLEQLYLFPTPERAERMAIELEGARLLVMRMRQAMFLDSVPRDGNGQ